MSEPSQPTQFKTYSEAQETPPPRRKKHPKQHAQHGAWKVAYADFVTAMMALFIVLWILNQSEAVKHSVQAYFQDPVGFNKSGGQVIPTTTSPVAQPTLTLDASNLERMEREVAGLKSLLEANEEFRDITDQIAIYVTDEGIRLEFRDASKFSFFAIGSANVTRELSDIIRILIPEVNRMNYSIVVEGHTDRRPYGPGATYTNWELSADRANGVRREMLGAGLTQDRITEVRAYASTRPLVEADPFAIENRRVSILLKNPMAGIMVQEELGK